jgi:serine/threonine protein kinase
MLWQHVVEFGVIHADPNPANYLVDPDGAVSLVDFGCVRRIPSDVSSRFRHLMRALLDRDEAGYQEFIAIYRDYGGDLANRGQVEATFLELARAWSEPLARDEPFVYTPDYVREEVKLHARLVRVAGAGLPRKLLYLTRVSLGAHHLFARLDVPENYHRLVAPLVGA